MINVKPDEILTILSRDAKTSPERLSEMTGQSVQDVCSTIEQYERKGIIKGYRAIIDWERAGLEKVLAFIDVKVAPSRESGFDNVACRIARFPEVKSVWLISGHKDLRVLVQGLDLCDLGNFVAKKLATIDGVCDTETHFMTRRYKEDDDLYEGSNQDKRGCL